MSAAEGNPPPGPLPEGRGPGGAYAKRPRRLLGLAVGFAAFFLAAAAVRYVVQRVTEPRDDLGRFQGTWKFAPNGREQRFPVTVKITGNQWVYVVADKEQKKYLLTLRPESSPKEIDLTQLDANDQPSAFVLRGIYAFEDGGVKVVTAPDPLPRPTAIDDPDGPPVWVLERP